MSASKDAVGPEARVKVGSIPVTGSHVPELRLWGIRRSIALAVVAAVLLVGGLIAAALWYAGWPGIKRDATVTAATLFDLLKLVFAVVAGMGGVAALVVAYRRQRVAEHTNALAEFAHQLAHAADLRAEVTKALALAADERAKIETERNGVRLYNERFAKASEELGSDKAAIRLAGVYAMTGLADDWQEGRQTCIDVICAYLRMPYAPPPPTLNGAQTYPGDQAAGVNTEAIRNAYEEREVRHTVIRLIGRHLSLAADDPTSWYGLDFDFTGVTFDGGDFSNATFSGGRVSFVGARFDLGEVTFARATFSGGEVLFDRARLCGGIVSFGHATFSGGRVSFDDAILNGGRTSFVRATFSDGELSFDGATFSAGALNFDRATFSGGRVSLDEATFSGARVTFLRAIFSDGAVSLDDATFSNGQMVYSGATFSGGRVSFAGTTFSGGRVSFDRAMFDGGQVSFAGAGFSGGEVRLDKAFIEVPATFDDWPTGTLPSGLLLPKA
ncbi:hypothetical protein AB0J68_04865 [Micromonospora sp. NPDC049580]|uniref:pentapeptide repeat-containing protein n=1 Tax=Micromonospora sp. NPDC049580 TaxID=3154832 RepID=UPI00341613D5